MGGEAWGAPTSGGWGREADQELGSVRLIRRSNTAPFTSLWDVVVEVYGTRDGEYDEMVRRSYFRGTTVEHVD